MIDPGVRISAVVLALCAVGCGNSAPSDDPADWDVDTSVEYALEVSPIEWLVPSSALPERAVLQPSNNNLDLELFEDRRFFSWRTGPDHWASSEVQLHVISSADEGRTWDYETTIDLDSDVREPRFVAISGALHLYYFEAGTDKFRFQPKKIWRTTRNDLGDWTVPVVHSDAEEVLWDVKVRGGVAYMGSYIGNHYEAGESAIDVFLKRSEDGVSWVHVDAAKPSLYRGGVSEIAYELDEDGTLWIVTRNEDGDATGFGSHLCSAPPGNMSAWQCPAKSDPERYDSPKMIRHGRDLYVIARRDIGGPYDQGLDHLDFSTRRTRYQLDYWNRPKRTAIYRIDKTARKLVHLIDLPSAGDTAYPAVRRLDAHTFLVANYTSPLADPDRTWVQGQGSNEGTQIYFVTLRFNPK